MDKFLKKPSGAVETHAYKQVTRMSQFRADVSRYLSVSHYHNFWCVRAAMRIMRCIKYYQRLARQLRTIGYYVNAQKGNQLVFKNRGHKY